MLSKPCYLKLLVSNCILVNKYHYDYYHYHYYFQQLPLAGMKLRQTFPVTMLLIA